MRRSMITVFVAAALCSTAGIAATGAQEILQQGNARLQSLTAERASLDQQASAAATVFMTSTTTDPATVRAEIEQVYTTAQAASVAEGHQRTRRALLAHLAAKPSAAASQAWMKDQSDELEREAYLATLSEFNLKASIRANTVMPFEVINALQRIFMMRGYSEGMAQELKQIGQDLAAYHGARTPAGEWDSKFGGVAAALAKEQTALLGYTTTCTQTLSRTFCAAS